MDAEQREQARLSALERYDVLDTPKELAFDRITQVTRKVFQVPMATVTFLDGHRQWFKSRQGLSIEETPKEHAFCRRVVENEKALVVADATKDARFADNPFVTGEPNVRFYAGMPLRTPEGLTIGTLCALDTKPREISVDQVDILADLAGMVMDELKLRLLANRDALTGALSRRAFKEEAARALSLAHRHNQPLSCLVFDLDGFKQINDTFGHATGDIVLEGAVKASEAQLRQSDVIGRIGGEEFAILLPQTGRTGARRTAEKLRTTIESLSFDAGEKAFSITASFGIATLGGKTQDVDALLGDADAALYEAKRTGRNRCVVWRAAEGETPTQRRRVLKGGQILFNGRRSIMDCTVRSLSQEGAGLAVISSGSIPPRFDLRIKGDNIDRPCRVISQTDRTLEVEFC
ncbi:MAG: diguanylate cyclase [Parvibaculaceae bacterium]